MIHFREYSPSDKQQIMAMMYELNAEDAQELPLQEKKIAVLFAFAPEKKWVSVFVAEKDEEVIGYAILIKAFSVEFGGLYAEVDEFYIKPERRAKGIGSAFLHWLELYAKDQGCSAMHLVATSQNTAAQRLYKRLEYNYLPRKSFLKILSK